MDFKIFLKKQGILLKYYKMLPFLIKKGKKIYIKVDYQFSFQKGWYWAPPQIDKEHKLIKIADTINWQRLTESLAKFYKKEKGRQILCERMQKPP